MVSLTVELGERSYPIYIGEGLLAQAGVTFEQHKLTKKSPLMIITDRHVADKHLPVLTSSLKQSGYSVVTAIVDPGEKSKSLTVLEKLIEQALQGGLDRNSAIVALGGGVVGDLAGFVAASFMRGIKFIQVPTTILAHDSSVGGKVAVNHPLAKNIIGAFHQPLLVLYDTSTFATLPEREIKAGFAEVIKHGLIWDRSFAKWCDEHVHELLALDAEAVSSALYYGCSIKAKVVSEDEHENGLRAILNLGHTIGHALEAVAGYDELLHGEAISIGMVGSAEIAHRLGYSADIRKFTERLLGKFGLPTTLPAHYAVDQLMEAMSHDKKFREGQIVFVVPTEIGKVEIRRDLSIETIKDVVESLIA